MIYKQILNVISKLCAILLSIENSPEEKSIALNILHECNKL